MKLNVDSKSHGYLTISMSKRIQHDWLVIDSVEDLTSQFCIDFFSRPDGSLGFEVFRRAAEDQGLWEPLSHYSVLSFNSLEACCQEALERFSWLAEVFDGYNSLADYCQHISTKLN